MIKPYALAAALATFAAAACSSSSTKVIVISHGAGDGIGGAGGAGGAGADAGCADVCAECVETQGQGRVALVCNDEPSGVTIFFEEGDVHRVCDGHTHNHCNPGTLCVAVSDGGMLNGTCQ